MPIQKNLHTIADWAEKTGLSYWVISQRINKLGWSAEEAITIPVIPYQNKLPYQKA